MFSTVNQFSLDLSIIIVNWNSWNDLHNCVQSIEKNAGKISYEIIIVDNNSSDNSIREIKAFSPKSILIENIVNVGFPAANNQGFRIAKGQYLLALNPDTLIKEDTLEKSIEFLKNDSTIGCLGVKTLKGNGDVLLSCARSYPTLWSAFCHTLYIDTMFKKSTFHKSSEMSHWDHNNSCDIDLLHGGYMMFPAKLYKEIGGFDERIPMFYEDIEFCCRVKKFGFRNYYLADYEIIHLVGTSISKANPKWISSLYCEADYLYFSEYGGGSKSAFIYVLMILFLTPFRIIYSPFIWIGHYLIKRRVKNLILINTQILASSYWAIKKLNFLIKQYYNAN
jgi:GT2 family glycosyltransferase